MYNAPTKKIVICQGKACVFPGLAEAKAGTKVPFPQGFCVCFERTFNSGDRLKAVARWNHDNSVVKSKGGLPALAVPLSVLYSRSDQIYALTKL